jgi:hypothetical protein
MEEGSMAVTKRQSVKHRRESKALDELCDNHDYMFQELRHERDRETMLFKHDKKTRESALTPALCIKLVVPAGSALGVRIVEMRKLKTAAMRSKR